MIILWLALAGPAVSLDAQDFENTVQSCLQGVQLLPNEFRTLLGLSGGTDRIDIVVDSGIRVTDETRDGVRMATCGTTTPWSLQLDADVFGNLRAIADDAGLIEIKLKAPGFFFADCHNTPNARFGLSVRPVEAGWHFQAVNSPAVGGPCGHSYGMQ